MSWITFVVVFWQVTTQYFITAIWVTFFQCIYLNIYIEFIYHISVFFIPINKHSFLHLANIHWISTMTRSWVRHSAVSSNLTLFDLRGQPMWESKTHLSKSILWYINTEHLVVDREAWHAAVRGVAKRWTRPSNWTEHRKYIHNMDTTWQWNIIRILVE